VKLTLYKRFVVMSATVALLFIFIGLLATIQVRHFERERGDSSPSAVYARLIDEISKKSGITHQDALKIVLDAEPENTGPQLEIITREQAMHMLTPNETLPLKPHEVRSVTGESLNASSGRIVKFETTETSDDAYLLVSLNNARHSRSKLFVTNFIVLGISVILASILSISLLFYFFRGRARVIAEVISRMKQGDLKARIPISRIDESTQFMLEFNKMADEIERLVERIRNTESARMRFFQELTHDLRTPVASLKSLLETLALKREALKPELQSELILLSLTEAEYFERLIEDLLFLAQVTEPHYRSQKREIDLTGIIDEELDRLELLYRATEKPVVVQRDFSDNLPEFKADPHLLRRLFRNALENAFSFAQSKVLVRIQWLDQSFEIHIEDDGPGLSFEALNGFGEKRVTRVINSDTKGRLSVGLGSVVMRTVATAHQGTVTITNHSNAKGADLKIVLKV